jgi:hypothetical protein
LSTFGNAAGLPWVFGGYGADVKNFRYAAAGTFNLTFNTGDTSATISKGLLDSNDNGTVKTGNSFTGTLSNPDATTGRGTVSLATGTSTGSLAYYYVGVSNGSLELIVIDTDPARLTTPIVMYTFRRVYQWCGARTCYIRAFLRPRAQ